MTIKEMFLMCCIYIPGTSTWWIIPKVIVTPHTTADRPSLGSTRLMLQRQ